jgi:hypothetical protein
MSDEQYKRDEATFKENCQFARGLNTQIMQIPAFAITLTGGLWFAAMTRDVENLARIVLFSFAAIADLALILVLFRLRDVMQSYLEKAKSFNEAAFSNGIPEKPLIPWLGRHAMVRIYGLILLFAAAVSCAGAAFYYGRAYL